MLPAAVCICRRERSRTSARCSNVARQVFGAANLKSLVEREFPLPDVVAKSKEAARMMQEGLVSFTSRGSRMLWRLQIWRCDYVPTN